MKGLLCLTFCIFIEIFDCEQEMAPLYPDGIDGGGNYTCQAMQECR